MEELRRGDWIAEVCPEWGMNTISLSYKGIEILRRPASMDELRNSPYVFGTPILLPPNRTADGVFFFCGKRYELPVNETVSNCHLHGSVHSAQFEVTDRTESTITATLHNRDIFFPFPFIIEAEYRLTEYGYEQVFVIKNSGNTPMPLTFGLHTTLKCNASFSVPIGEKYERDKRNLPTGRLVGLSSEEQCYVYGAQNKTSVSGYFTSAGNTAIVDGFRYNVSGFDHWTLWNGGGERGFIAIEPQCGAVNCLNNGMGLRSLGVGESSLFRTLISPERDELV